MSVVIFVNRMMSGIIALSYESMSDAMTAAGSFFFFAALSAISVFFYFFLVSVFATTTARAYLPHMTPVGYVAHTLSRFSKLKYSPARETPFPKMPALDRYSCRRELSEKVSFGIGITRRCGVHGRASEIGQGGCVISCHARWSDRFVCAACWWW